MDVSVLFQTARSLGVWGERVAILWLWLRGFRVLTHNWRTQCGELDIVAMRWSTLHVVEVKTRRNNWISPSRAVTRRKQQRIIRATREYIGRRKLIYRRIQFDVLEVVWAGRLPRIHPIWDAFRADD